MLQILPQETNSLCYKIDVPSANLFLDFTIKSAESVESVSSAICGVLAQMRPAFR